MTRLHRIIRRSNQVRRFHTEPVIVEETVGHHSANVVAILIDLYQPEFPPAALIVAALYHDLDEYYTGDAPAPVKKENPSVKAAMDRAGDRWRRHYKLTSPVLRQEEFAVLKFADAYDCVLSFTEEAILRNNHQMMTPLRRALGYMSNAYLKMPQVFKDKAKPWVQAVLETTYERE